MNAVVRAALMSAERYLAAALLECDAEDPALIRARISAALAMTREAIAALEQRRGQ